MATSENRDQDFLHHVVLADDDLGELILNAGVGVLAKLDRFRVGHRRRLRRLDVFRRGNRHRLGIFIFRGLFDGLSFHMSRFL